MELVRFAWSRIKGDLRRSLATFAAVAIAVTSFVVLAASTATQQATVTETAEANYRAAYDILVRPRGSALEKERVEGLVRSNYLSGTFSGLTLDQVDAVKAVPGVEVAAPIAMVGFQYQELPFTYDTAPWLDEHGRTLLRWRTTATARNQTASAPGPAGYRYQTDAELLGLEEMKQGWSFDESEEPPAWVDGGRWERINGSDSYPCPQPDWDEQAESLFESRVLWEGGQCLSARDAVRYPEDAKGLAQASRVQLRIIYPMLIAAVDPAAEAALVGLDKAVYEGSYFTPSDGATEGDTIPVILAGTQAVDYQVRLTLDRLSRSTIDGLGEISEDWNRGLLDAASPEETVDEQSWDAADLYADTVAGLSVDAPLIGATYGGPQVPLSFTRLWRLSDTSYRPGSPLRPLTRTIDPAIWRATFISSNSGFEAIPMTAQDTGFRDVTAYTVYEADSTGTGGTSINFDLVGKFDPSAIKEFSGLSAVPLETYTSPELVGADDASRTALGGRPMGSDLNIAGYLQQSPAMLVPLASLDAFSADRLGVFEPETFVKTDDFDDTAPISAVRVRVAGVTGMDDLSRERIAAVAASIADVVDADVDITIGSSPELQQVELPETALGSPALTLLEPWSRKGVAVQIVAAIDAKSLLLFGLILVSSALTVAISADAAVRTRRRELGILAAVGWTPGRRRRAVLIELALLGGAAGATGALLSWPLTGLAQARFEWTQALLAVPGAVLLTVLAGAVAAWRAGRIRPIEALQSPELGGGRRMLPVRGGRTLGLARILRRPGRLALGALAIALPVASILVLVSLAQVFRGRVVGTLLGDAVAVLVRPQDLVAGGFLGLLGLVAVALIVFLNLSEDARMYASLLAVGWRQAWLARSLVVQAVAISVLGSALGLAGGLAIMVWLTESIPAEVATIAAVVVAATMAASLLTALVPAAVLRRLPAARLLAEE